MIERFDNSHVQFLRKIADLLDLDNIAIWNEFPGDKEGWKALAQLREIAGKIERDIRRPK